MKRISVNARFINKAGDNLIESKIHTIRQNYEFWKKFQGKELALFTWEGKAYRSKQKVFCVKKLFYVQKLYLECRVMTENGDKALPDYYVNDYWCNPILVPKRKIAKNDGFDCADELDDWAFNHGWDDGVMAILHFTDFEY